MRVPDEMKRRRLKWSCVGGKEWVRAECIVALLRRGGGESKREDASDHNGFHRKTPWLLDGFSGGAVTI